MARKSRKHTQQAAAVQAVNAPKTPEQIYNTGLYARISSENERKREFDTIGTQIQLLRDYASEHDDLKVVDIYCDDGVTGTNFSRPEFSRMMNDVREGRINCILVKDLSRFGRNFLETGEYIELVLPFFGVRFISITDGFDSKYNQADLVVQIKNMANEMYAKDISKKISTTMRNLQLQGKFSGSRAPYGYQLDPNDKHHLIIDEETAPIVQKIFQMIADGNTIHAVSTYLNGHGIPSPGKRMYEKGISKTDKFKNSIWYTNTLTTILKNRTYLGWTVSGTTRSEYYKTGTKGSRAVAEPEWIITKGTHEPIVTENLFGAAQDYLKELHSVGSLSNKTASKGALENKFRGILKCGECGRSMSLRRKKTGSGTYSYWYVCNIHENYSASLCPKKAMKQETVDNLVLRLINLQIKVFLDTNEVIRTLNRRASSTVRYKIYHEQMSDTENKIRKYRELKASLFEDYVAGKISREDYLTMGQDYAERADEMSIFLSELRKDADKYNPEFIGNEYWAEIVEKYQNAETLTSDMIAAFVERVTLFNDGHAEIVFKFKEELDMLYYMASLRQKESGQYDA